MSSLSPLPRLALLVGGLLLAGATQAWAAPKLIVALVAEEDPARSIEASVQEELSLALDEVALEVRALTAPGFGRMPLAEQLPLIEPWTQEDEVLAVTWLDPLSGETLRLHVVFASEGRAVLRVVEADAEDGGAPALALALREVLALVVASREAANDEAEAVPEPEPQSPARWDLHVLGGLGLRGQSAEGPPLLGSLEAGVTVGVVGRLSLGVEGLLLFTRPSEAPVSLTSAGGGLRLHWLPGSDRVGGGPVLSVLLLGTRLTLQDGDQPSVQHADLRIAPGAALRIEPLPELGIVIQGTLDLLPRPWEARQRSTGELLFSSAGLQARLAIGITVRLPSRGARAAGSTD